MIRLYHGSNVGQYTVIYPKCRIHLLHAGRRTEEENKQS